MTINRPPRDGNMAFVRSPDNISIEILQKGAALPPAGAMGVDAEYRQVVSRPAVTMSAGRSFAACFAAALAYKARRTRPSSSGPGRRPFTAETRVRIPLGRASQIDA